MAVLARPAGMVLQGNQATTDVTEVMAMMAVLARPAGMVLQGHQATTDVTEVMAMMGLKVIKVTEDCRGRLDLMDLLVVGDLLVLRERKGIKEKLEPRVLPVKIGNLARCLLRIGKNVPGTTWMIRRTVV